jgi:ribosomal protein S18 acetylase RimI-like enzyme
MSSADWKIRPATIEDAAALSALAERTFRDTFAADNSADDMDAYCASAFGVDIQSRELSDPAAMTLVVEEDGHLVGYAQLVRRPPPLAVPARRPMELKRFYVHKAFHGSSMAPALMSAAEERARAFGADVVWLGVWERNPRAIRFYQKSGFQEIGAQTFAVGADLQRDLVMSRAIA